MTTPPPYPPPPGGPPPYGSYGPPGGYPQQPPRKKSNAGIIVGIVAAVFVLCGMGGCVAFLVSTSDSDDADATFSQPTTSIQAEIGPDPASPGQPSQPPAASVRDGKFEFTVVAVDPPVPVVGDDFLQETAQGEFIVVHLTIGNTSKEAQSYSSDDQKLVDTQNREYTPDSGADLIINGESAWFTEINPGNAIQVALAYDVSPGTVPAKLEVHDSFLSDGATIALR
ncbi:DUF4352 domain-containing protein [Nocardia camponoti]|uniref:Mpr protein n=1 Tax=Nocardia camponoti TaxID=1616106 RepID=A0A917VBH9_9NOCA|nr:DUF4352 domain-containing protein [Nocardia camponoti]GGK59422.1 Mpr protein [Nocardia camponoti]